MNEKKTINPPINPGISLLVVVFLVLCLFTFSAITLTTALNEQSRCETSARTTKEYYDAVNKAETQINKIVDNLKKSGEISIAKQIDITEPIDDSQELQIVLTPITDTNTEKYFKIIKWQVVSTVEWEADDTLNLLVP